MGTWFNIPKGASVTLFVDLEFEIIIWGQLVTYYTRNYIFFSNVGFICDISLINKYKY